jgi:hypothetical protein
LPLLHNHTLKKTKTPLPSLSFSPLSLHFTNHNLLLLNWVYRKLWK